LSASVVLEALKKIGVRDILVCPGARNAVFVQALSQTDEFNVIWHFEERCAGFFAVGRAVATDRPVAVITTSGTAAGELVPAMMEAFYSGVPLVTVTADRPRSFRGSGAPQAAEQVGIYGVYAPISLDVSEGESVDLPEFVRGPVHINVCLGDPKGTPLPFEGEGAGGEGRTAPNSISEFLNHVEKPLVIVGQLRPSERDEVEHFLVELNAPTYLEATSGLRGRPRIESAVAFADGILRRHDFDGILRIGGVPTHRLWRDLEDSQAHLPVFSVSRVPFTGLSRPSGLTHEVPAAPRRLSRGDLMASERSRYQNLVDLLRSERQSEPGMVHELSRRIEESASIYLGNSLPIREWDLAGEWRAGHDFRASRGLNGIDGQLSAFLGGCDAIRPNWALLGDLTLLYDLAGLWPCRPSVNATIVVMNNSGGKIFDRMFENPAFQNRHALNFQAWAEMWSIGYERIEDPIQIQPNDIGIRLIELIPNAEATARFWAKHAELLA
jgi:2-succinyl-5-enolpyruvyl-6-hydroxy-3-cyclohexene-1-carboxylate synthase